MTKSINTRINQIKVNFFGNERGSHKLFTERLGIASNTASNWFKEGYNVGRDVIAQILRAFPEIDGRWLVLGEGEMLKSNDKPTITYCLGRPYYNVDFIGGFDLIFNDQTTNPDYNIDYRPYNKDGVLWCNLTGHSMEPEISQGDKIALKEVSDWQDFIALNETYAIVTKNDLRTVKKIRKGSDEMHWLLVPVNPDYEAQEISLEMVLRVFAVLGCIKTL